jgi:hypothetical protein
MNHVLILGALATLVACDSTGPTAISSPNDRPEFATTSVWVPLDPAPFRNDCPPAEDVVFSGKAHLVTQTQGNKVRIFINWGGVKGTGAVTGDRYVIADNYHERDVFTATGGTAESFERLRMIRQGNADNLLGLAHVIFDFGSGTLTLFEITMKCVG